MHNVPAIGRGKFLIILCAAAILPGGYLHGDAGPLPWPMYRGNPALTGVATVDLPDRWELRWTFKTGDAIKSAAAIEGNRVVIGSDDGNVYALAADTGKKLWSFKTEDTVEAAPLLLGGMVYIGSSDANLYALDAGTGALKWTYKTNGKILGAANWLRVAPAGQPRASRSATRSDTPSPRVAQTTPPGTTATRAA